MTGQRRWRARGGLAVLAAAGVAVAHRLAYAVVSPDVHMRSELLEHTGHRYFGIGSSIVFGLLVATTAGFVASRARIAPTRSPSARWRSVAARLALLQAPGWFALEAAERVLAAHHHGSMFHEPVLWVGLAVQLLVAALSALLFVGANRALAAFGERSRGPLGGRTTKLPLRPESFWLPRVIRRGDAWGWRAPPACFS